MSGFFQNLSQAAENIISDGISGGVGLPGPVVLRDWQHASRIFRSNFYKNAPKFKFLFHTYFAINPTITPFASGTTTPLQGLLQGSLGSFGANNYGLLVKEVKLPSFTFTNVQYNQYNRKRIVQTKIKYDPIEITFHDDNADQVTQLWESYYTYYYNDGLNLGNVLSGAAGGPQSTNSLTNYNTRNTYVPSTGAEQENNWGFSGGQDSNGATTGSKQPFFKNITVFGFNRHNFTAFTFVNPIIASFQHDSYNYSEGGGTMQNRMTIDYEAVAYNYGSMDGKTPGDIVTGFGQPESYDTTPSPIGLPGSNSAALGVGGLIDAAGGFLNNPNGYGNPLAAIQLQNAAYNGFNTTSNLSVGGVLNTLYRQVAQNSPVNRNTPFSIPNAMASPGPLGLANSPVIGALTQPPSVAYDGVTTNSLGDNFNAVDTSTDIGIAQDPTLDDQIFSIPGNSTVISYSDPTAELVEAQYASSNGPVINPSNVTTSQAANGQLVADQQDSQLLQIYNDAGSLNSGSVDSNDGNLPDDTGS